MSGLLERVAAVYAATVGRVVALITPFGRGASYFRMSAGLRWFLHAVVLLGVLVLLGWINYVSRAAQLWINSPNFAPWLCKVYFPLIFFLLYAMAWLGWWLWKLLGPEDTASDFPDIDEAWAEAVQALNESGIELTDAPLFLVLGKPAGGEEPLLNAAQLSLTVKQAPKRPNAPLHVYANRDGIYVTCAGASVLGRQAAVLNGEVEDGTASGGGDGAPEDDPFKTLRPKGRLKEVQNILSKAREEGRSPDQLTDAERAEIQALIMEEEAEQGQRGRRPQTSFLKNAAEVERLSARLRHLCRLIVRDRRPYCPLNGILLLVPFAAADRDEDASHTASAIHSDLTSARDVLQVHCPVFAMVCDLELAAGFREFLERFPADQRQRRLGQRFPLMPDLEPEKVPEMVDGGMEWVCQSMIPNWVYKLFRVEGTGQDVRAVMQGNARLFRFLGEMRERQKRFGRVFQRGIVNDGDGLTLFGGCYVAGTGKDSAREQAFVAGVFRRLLENQNYVSWTDAALREESDNQRWTYYGYTGLVVALLVLIGLGTLVWFRSH
jgi:hypothetical protein